MDAIDILGTLLGRKTQQGGSGGQILKDQLGGNRPAAPVPAKQIPAKPAPAPMPTQRIPAPPQSPVLPHPSVQPQLPPSRSTSVPSARASLPERVPVQESMNEQAKVLVRAMVSATKSDGQITEEEQNAIVKQLGHVGDAEVNFLRSEFAAPLDVRELAWSIPLGMEDQAYAISLIAINLDEQSEVQYLGELAHGLRLTPERCNEIHRKYGAPEIFR